MLGTVFGQVETAAKSNEISAARDLVSLVDLDQVVATVDAVRTRYDTATLIVTGGGNEVFTVKFNRLTHWLGAPCNRARAAVAHFMRGAEIGGGWGELLGAEGGCESLRPAGCDGATRRGTSSHSALTSTSTGLWAGLT